MIDNCQPSHYDCEGAKSAIIDVGVGCEHRVRGPRDWVFSAKVNILPAIRYHKVAVTVSDTHHDWI
jgi:hypothetical protein